MKLDFGATVRAGTSFALGRDHDEDPRPYVLVCREFGSRLYPTPPWVAYDVSYDRGVRTPSRRTFDDQAAALAYGWKRLAEMRERGEWFCLCTDDRNGREVKQCGRCGEQRPAPSQSKSEPR